MPFTAGELTDIANGTLETYLKRGQVLKQNIANKPMLKAFDEKAGTFPGGKEVVSFAVRAGQGGGTLQGYSGDDQVAYYNPTGTKRARFPWKEHHIGLVITHTELKTDGIDVIEDGDRGEQDTRQMPGREKQVLVNLLDEKMETLGEDYSYSMDRLIHGDGSSDSKVLAGIGSIILPAPTLGTTGGISRPLNTYWRNRAATAANAAQGGQGAITSATANGGALISFLETEDRIRAKYRVGADQTRIFAGSAWIDAYLLELRANGNYTLNGWQGQGNVDGGMDAPKFKGRPIEYDPTLDDLGLSKRAYFIDMGSRGVKLMYMDGQRMKKHKPARPYDRYVLYNGITTTAVMIAYQLNTSAVYDIA